MNKVVITLLFLFFFLNSNAQYFNNSNNELSYQLTEKLDEIGKYRIYLVIEDLTNSDFDILKNWDDFKINQKKAIIEEWQIYGKRVEIERFPYSSYKPIFFIKIANPKILKTI